MHREKIMKPYSRPLRFIFTPISAYFIGFIFPYLLTRMEFVNSISSLSNGTNTLIIASAAFFLLGVLCMRLAWRRAPKKAVHNMNWRPHALANEKLLLNILCVWMAIGLTCLSAEFLVLGGMPLLMSNIEVGRMALQVNGYVHLVAISTGVAAAVAAMAAVHAQKRSPFYALSVLGIFSVALTGNRYDAMLPIVVAVIYVMMAKGGIINIKNLIFGLIFIALFAFIKIYREEANGAGYIQIATRDLIGEATSLRIALYPLYMTIAYNFRVFDWLNDSGAGTSLLSGGLYTFNALLSVLPLKYQEFGQYKNHILGITFYGELTSTYISNFYLDFGATGVCIGSLILGVLTQLLFQCAEKDRRFLPAYAYVYVNTLLFFYTFIYIYTATFINLICYAIFGLVSLSKWQGSLMTTQRLFHKGRNVN